MVKTLSQPSAKISRAGARRSQGEPAARFPKLETWQSRDQGASDSDPTSEGQDHEPSFALFMGSAAVAQAQGGSESAPPWTCAAMAASYHPLTFLRILRILAAILFPFRSEVSALRSSVFPSHASRRRLAWPATPPLPRGGRPAFTFAGALPPPPCIRLQR